MNKNKKWHKLIGAALATTLLALEDLEKTHD